jgi:hypothetical protein
MIIGLVFIVSYDHIIDTRKVVGVFLLFIGVMKFFPKLQTYLKLFIEKQLRLYYVFIGLTHGISNMGGGPLSILMSTVYSEKVKIRANIAFIYLVLALFQLIILFIIEPSGLQHVSVNLMLTSLFIYLIANRYFSDKVDDKKYVFLINILILIYGVLALTK